MSAISPAKGSRFASNKHFQVLWYFRGFMHLYSFQYMDYFCDKLWKCIILSCVVINMHRQSSSECFGTPRTRFESVPWFVSCHLCEHSHRFDHRHYIIYPRNKWPLRLSYFYVTVITLFWQQNVTVILTQKFLSVLCRSWASICHIKKSQLMLHMS